MLTALLVAATFGADAEAPPAKRDLFAKEGWYKEQAGKEMDFVGTLEKVPPPVGVGFGRNNPYRLVMDVKGKKVVRSVYVGGKPEPLAPYAGKKVKLIGKAVDFELEGSEQHEIWPARVELLPADKEPAKDDKKDGDK